MRGIVVVLLLALGLSAGATVKVQTRAFEEIIIDAIECIRDLMLNGWDEWDLPHLNPLYIDDLEVDLSIAMVDGLSGNLRITNGVIANAPFFEIESVSGTIGLIPPSYTVRAVLRFERLDVEGDYELDFAFNDYELWGNGNLRAGALDSSIDLSAKATILGGISLEYFDLWLDMNGLNYFEVTGVRGDEEYSQQVTDYVNENWKEVVDGLAPIVHDIASEAALNLVNEGGLGEEDGLLSDLVSKCLGSK